MSFDQVVTWCHTTLSMSVSFSTKSKNTKLGCVMGDLNDSYLPRHISPWSCGHMILKDERKTFYLHFHKIYKHQNCYCGDLWLGAPFFQSNVPQIIYFHKTYMHQTWDSGDLGSVIPIHSHISLDRAVIQFQKWQIRNILFP